MNHERKPFDDKRVRRALTLALDRYEASRNLSRIMVVKEVGASRCWDALGHAAIGLEHLPATCDAAAGRSAPALREAGVPRASRSLQESRDSPATRRWGSG
jgi:peptide/nickel transport system substrate-binding protein